MDFSPKAKPPSTVESGISLALSRAIAPVILGGFAIGIVLLARRYPAPITADEVKYLLLAKYLGSGNDLGYYGTAMPGWSLMLRATGLFVGGFGSLSAGQAYHFAIGVNAILIAFIGLASNRVLLIFGVPSRDALLGAFAVITMPVFFVWVGTAMSEIARAAALCGFTWSIAVIIRRELHPGALAGVLVTAFFVSCLHAFGVLYIVISVGIVVGVMRNRASLFIAVAAGAGVAIVMLLALRYNYDAGEAWSRFLGKMSRPSFWLTLAVATLQSLFFSALLAMIAGVPSRIERTLFAVAAAVVIGFLIPAAALSSLFHATIDTFTNYRSVIGIEPAVLLVILTCALTAAHLRFQSIRLVATMALFAGILVLPTWQFFQTNLFDWLTALPVFDYITASPIMPRERALLALVMLQIAAAIAVVLPRVHHRVFAIIAINLGLSGYFSLHSWSKDPWGRDAGYAANMAMARFALSKEQPIRLVWNEQDHSWFHFAYPYLWAARERTSISKDVAGPLIITHDRKLDGREPLYVAPSPSVTFYAY